LAHVFPDFCVEQPVQFGIHHLEELAILFCMRGKIVDLEGIFFQIEKFDFIQFQYIFQ
jgi:hypothetical protein